METSVQEISNDVQL